MAYTAYDWQQTLIEKADYAEGRLRHGSPVAALSCDEGMLLLTVRKNQPKLYEIYDRLAMGALGNPSDLETVRQFAVDFSHAEGYQRSAEDVSIQRVVGFAISPAFKRAFSDPRLMPMVLKAVFAQVGETPEEDALFVLSYDGEFHRRQGAACIAGSAQAESRMAEVFKQGKSKQLKDAISLALSAWIAGQWSPPEHRETKDKGQSEGPLQLPSTSEGEALLQQALAQGDCVEAALLARRVARDRRFRALSPLEISPFLPNLKP